MLPRACSGALYEALELSPDCTSGDVKRQYRKLALQYHPDRTGGTTTDRFQEIERANHILSSTVTRRLYDQFGSSGLQLVNTDSDDLEEQFRSAVRRIQAVFAVVFVLLAGLFVSACVACHLADASWGRGTVHGPQGPSPLAWGLTFIPVYVLCVPTLLVAAGLAISAVSHCSLVLWLWSLESFVTIALVGTSVAALTGRTHATTAIVTWMVWYSMRAVRKLFLILPPVFALDIFEAEVAAQQAAQAAEADGANATGASAPEAVLRMTASEVMCLGGYWFGAVLPTVAELCCVWSFFGMCLVRATGTSPARQASVRAVSSKVVDGGVVSFWAVFAPLIVLACLRIALKTVVIAFFADSVSSAARARRADAVVIEGVAPGDVATDARTHTTATTTGVYVSAAATAAPPPSCGEIVSSAITFSVPEMALLWMACGWAATANRLFNEHQPPQRFYQTAWMASLPLLAMLLFPAMLVLGLTIIVSISGRTLFGVDRDPYADHAELDGAALDGGGDTPRTAAAVGREQAAKHSTAPLAAKGSPGAANYRSTDARPGHEAGLADVD